MNSNSKRATENDSARAKTKAVRDRHLQQIRFEVRDGTAAEPAPGHYLITVPTSRQFKGKGTAYVILASRRIQRRRLGTLPQFALTVQKIPKTAEVEQLAEWRMQWDQSRRPRSIGREATERAR